MREQDYIRRYKAKFIDITGIDEVYAHESAVLSYEHLVNEDLDIWDPEGDAKEDIRGMI